MSDQSVRIQLKINFPVVFTTVLLVHILLLFINRPDIFKLSSNPTTEKRERVFKIQDIRTLGSKESKSHNMPYIASKTPPAPTISPRPLGQKTPNKDNLSLRDLMVGKESKSPRSTKQASALAQTRPGKRPEPFAKQKPALNAISLRGDQIQQFSSGANAAALSGDPRTRTLQDTDVMVNLEVPEGVTPDELNEFELMFYSFQRRTAINYINSFYKNLDKFQRENPHLQFPMTDQRQVMTGRLTYDEKGNIKQIKMIRWSNVDRLQDFFVDVLKDMDTLHNPPKLLWSKNGEFSIFFSLVLNG